MISKNVDILPDIFCKQATITSRVWLSIVLGTSSSKDISSIV